MKRLMHDLQFIFRNWRFFHAHGVLGLELRQWWNDYDPPKKSVGNYTINVQCDTEAFRNDLARAQAMYPGVR